MFRDCDTLFKSITEKIAETDFSGYTTQYPPLFIWNDKFDDSTLKRLWKNALKDNGNKFGLYIHIPYCKQKCTFCRYFSVELTKEGESEVEDYLNSLEKEMLAYKDVFSRSSVSTLYFGGGTPAILNGEQIVRIFNSLFKNFDFSKCEQIAFEGNPDLLDKEKLILLKRSGVNRLTIGVQSLEQSVIKKINRFQTKEAFISCYNNARELGIRFINIDLMAGLPGQSVRGFMRTIDKIAELKPDMVHIHPFYPTKNSLFMQNGNRLTKRNILKREEMCRKGNVFLRKRGYLNLKFDAMGNNPEARNIQLSDAIEYNSPFLGLGPGAVSHATGYCRYANVNRIHSYNHRLSSSRLAVSKKCLLTRNYEKTYFLTSALRYGKINKGVYKKLFGEDVCSSFKAELEYLEKREKIENKNNFIVSRVNSVGEYLIFSKYLYDEEIIKRCKKLIPKTRNIRNMHSSEYQYILL